MRSDSTAATKKQRRRENLETGPESFHDGPWRRVILAAGSKGRVTASPKDIAAVIEVHHELGNAVKTLVRVGVDLFNAVTGNGDRPSDDRLAEYEELFMALGAVDDG